MKKQHILLLDNYDSFTYNLLHYLEEINGITCEVIRNDAFDPDRLSDFDAIILSPGPGLPEGAGILLPLISQCYQSKKILGVCLGLQAIVVAFGGALKQLDNVMHGLQRNCIVTDKNDKLFAGIKKIFPTGRYHSWVADEKKLPMELIVSAVDEQGEIMAIHHRHLPVYGVQFHPESIMTPSGKQIIRNWLEV